MKTEQNAIILNERIDQWVKNNNILLTATERRGLAELIEHHADRVAAQRVLLNQSSFSEQGFRAAYSTSPESAWWNNKP
jgi:type IV secretory pathway VirB4 component